VQLALALLCAASGARADVVVRAPNGACLADVAAGLLARVLPADRTGELSTGGVPLAGSALLGVPPLVHGALLVVDGPPAVPILPGLAELRVVAGPSAGTIHRLVPGTLELGRDPDAGVRLDDPEVSRRHCRLTVTHTGASVTDLASTNGSWLDGSSVGAEPVALAPGAVLRLGGTSLVLAGPTGPLAPLGPAAGGRRAFNRPPRLRPADERVQVVVPAPPAARERQPVPLLAVLVPLLLGVGMWRLTGSSTFLLLTLLSPVLVLGNVLSDLRTGRRRSRRERALWQAAREVAERTLEAAVRADEIRRRTAAPDAAEVLLTALGPLPRLWERRREDADLLELRLGLADQPARLEAEGDLAGLSTTARSVPVVVPLREVGVLGIAGLGPGCREAVRALARSVIAAAVVWHSPRDLSLVVLAEPAAAAAWDWAGWLPHARPDGGQDCRALLGLGPEQAAARVTELTTLVETRRAERGGSTGGARGDRTDPRPVLVLVDGARALRAVPGLAGLLAEGPAVGVYAVCLEDDLRLLPEECGAIARVGPSGALTVRVAGRPELTGACADLPTAAWADAVARALAPLRDDSRDRTGAGGLPASVRWTEVVSLPLTGGDGDAAGVLSRWSFPGRSTCAVLGRGADGVFSVDLSRDGPHALVAGTTGSGKSELLQTLIASLALVNRPDELTFVLIDYKGGAAFGPCARLPHTVGLVTDLDGSRVERALTSLRAELSRREAVLQSLGAKDIEEHRRVVGSAPGGTAPLPRLVIVVDEFASLVEELPDFVGGLVGIALRGRSLGVHLVLATQRPEGVVSPDIRANTNLRLCLAVTRDTESRDVLDSPVAARISRSTPGRAWARTGHAELTAFQAGRVGGRRPSVVAQDAAPTVELRPPADLGSPVPRSRAEEPAEQEVTDLSLFVDACVTAAARLGLPAQRSPWLPPLPDQLVLADLPTPQDPLAGRPGRVPPAAYGLVDVPDEQTRRALVLDLDRTSHLMVVGTARSGRTTALRTLAGALASSTSPDDVHLYVLDLGGGLGPLAALPHTGAVAGRDCPERVDRVLGLLAGEVGRRQAMLADQGHADLAEQRAAAAPADRLPHLVLLLDRWEAFVSTWSDVDAGRLVDVAHRLLREGPSVGVHVVLTVDRSGLIGRISSLVEDKLLLRLADRGDYVAAGLPARLVPTDLPPGRGWSLSGAPLVAQVALLDPDPGGPAQLTALTTRAAAQGAAQLHRPRRVEPLPAAVRLTDLPSSTRPGCVVLGVGGDELDPVELDLAAAFPGLLVGGPAGSGRSSVLLTIAEGLRGSGLPVVAVAPRISPLRALPGCVRSLDAAAELEQRLGDGRRLLLVDDAELLVDSGLAHVLERAVREARDAGTLIVAAGSTEDLVAGYRGFVVELRKSRTGLLLSPQSAGDGDLLGVRLSRSTGGQVRPGRGLLVRRGRVEPLQVAQAADSDAASLRQPSSSPTCGE